VYVILSLLAYLCVCRDYASKISDILDEMGRASAVAQGLQKAVTSGERLRNSDHTVYLLIDPEGKR
jgi:alpha-tubulin N-acetyltransferase 1